MKKILLSLTLPALMLISFACNNSKQSELPSPQKTNTVVRNTKSAAILGTAAHNFVNTFYNSASYTVGRQVNTTVNSQVLIVSEIVLGATARGYLVTERGTQTPLYFADVDRTNFVLTSVDITKNETITAQNINQNPDYLLTNEFDFIGVVLDFNNNSNSQGRPFFGWGAPTGYGPCIPLTFLNEYGETEVENWQHATESYYVFGIKVRTRETAIPC